MSTLGADPEVLLYSEQDKEYVPSIGLIGGSKAMPDRVDGGAVQEDNVTAEFNIDPVPLDDFDAFNTGVRRMQQEVMLRARVHGLRTVSKASAKFEEKYLQHPQAYVSGCDPDMNVYTGEENLYPNLKETQIRCAGGHLHFGDTGLFADPGSREHFIMCCDYFVGLPLAMLDPDTERYKTYGKAGNFRYKPYGVEYRTPSNHWLSSEKLTRMVHTGMGLAKAALAVGDGALIEARMRDVIKDRMDARDRLSELSAFVDPALRKYM